MRWGEHFDDERDWKEYNSELVKRGEFFLDLDWVNSWNAELKEMNRSKMGPPFEFPDSLIRVQAVWNQFFGVRQIEGLTKRLAAYGNLPKYNDHSTIHRRIGRLRLKLELPEGETLYLSFDGSGMKISDGGDYRHTNYGRKKRKWVRVKIAVDVRTKKLIACSVDLAGEGPSESDTAILQMEDLLDGNRGNNRVAKAWGDGGFDRNRLFNFLEKREIDSAIPVQKNARICMKKSPRRSLEVFEQQHASYRKWANETEYGQRWAVEGYFSAIKRVFGETTRAKKKETRIKECERRFLIFEEMRNYGRGSSRKSWA